MGASSIFFWGGDAKDIAKQVGEGTWIFITLLLLQQIKKEKKQVKGKPFQLGIAKTKQEILCNIFWKKENSLIHNKL